ncbi:glycoside hydrolase family 39 protein [Macroventuria anomochaeta]|uniref:Glycoside hydrolase family 39 protein n=1 Tax=Macroventuria anomochaeta TaxID=301207 RepID=A0ACB6RZW9_9PLEO|nr:glycoside hydrolase family 39 protein [Macroventuria anomochaeta]KAF2627253.1 glycoside hydrolase family 39 protein [Macroventuria anomochaeta]
MLEGLVFDFWNDPDLKFFWNRPRSQWLRELPTVRISDPCFSHVPDSGDERWADFLTLVKQDSSIPDEWPWHMEQGHRASTTSIVTFSGILKQQGIPESGVVNINDEHPHTANMATEYKIASLKNNPGYANWLIDIRAILRRNGLWRYTQSDGTSDVAAELVEQLVNPVRTGLRL